MKKALTMVKSVVSVSLTVLIVLMVAFVIQTQVAGGKAQVFGHEIMTVLSGSMEPDIQTGSLIAVESSEDPGGYEVGDVITYEMANETGAFITHRVVEVEEDDSAISYLTQGDNNDAPDRDPVTSHQVVGHYNGLMVPYIGYAIDFVQSDLGIVLMLIVPGVLLLLSSFFQVWRMMRAYEQARASAMVEVAALAEEDKH